MLLGSYPKGAWGGGWGGYPMSKVTENTLSKQFQTVMTVLDCQYSLCCQDSCSVVLARSRSEQAPGSEFHPGDESDKIDCCFLGPSWCNKKVNPET